MKPGEPFNTYRLFHNAWVPIQVLARVQISHCAKLLYGRLRAYAGKDGRAWPSDARLASDMGLSVRTIRRRRAELKQAGLIRDHASGKGVEFLWITELEPVQNLLTDWPDLATEAAKSGHASLEADQEADQGATNSSGFAQGAAVENSDSVPKIDPDKGGATIQKHGGENRQAAEEDNNPLEPGAQVSHNAPPGPRSLYLTPLNPDRAQRTLDPEFTRSLGRKLQTLSQMTKLNRQPRLRSSK